MRHQIVSHEELLKTRREPWDNERCGEMISNTTRLSTLKSGRAGNGPKQARAVCCPSQPRRPSQSWRSLREFKMAACTGMLCAAGANASPLTGMVSMYLLMGAFHSAPWLRLITNWRSGAHRC